MTILCPCLVSDLISWINLKGGKYFHYKKLNEKHKLPMHFTKLFFKVDEPFLHA